MRHKNWAAYAVLLIAGLAWPFALGAAGQNLPDAPDTVGAPIPMITGFVAFHSNPTPGSVDVAPEWDPIVLFPVGQHFLALAEFDMGFDVVRDSETKQWGPAVLDKTFDYMQGDILVNKNLIIVGGRYLTPFGIYRERLHPLWIRYLQAEPISFTLNDSSGNGGMVRGGTHVSDNVDVTYAVYYSAASTKPLFDSQKMVGFRGSAVILNQHMEIGASFNNTMGDGPHKMFGTDFTWEPKRVPVEIRSETIFSAQAGRTYWVEGAYRLSSLGKNVILRDTNLVYRQEEYWLPKSAATMPLMGGKLDELPDTTTTRSTFGANFLVTPSLRFDVSYQGNYATEEHTHMWTFGATYRYAIF